MAVSCSTITTRSVPVDCHFRRMPPPPPGFDETASECGTSQAARCLPGGIRDVSSADPRVRQTFLAFHRDLLDAAWWQDAQALLVRGDLAEVLSYPAGVRFARRPPHPPDPPAIRTGGGRGSSTVGRGRNRSADQDNRSSAVWTARPPCAYLRSNNHSSAGGVTRWMRRRGSATQRRKRRARDYASGDRGCRRVCKHVQLYRIGPGRRRPARWSATCGAALSTISRTASCP